MSTPMVGIAAFIFILAAFIIVGVVLAVVFGSNRNRHVSGFPVQPCGIVPIRRIRVHLSPPAL